MPADVDRPTPAPSVRAGRGGAAPPPAAGSDDDAPRPRASDYLLDAIADLRRDLDRTRFVLRLAGAERAEDRPVVLLQQHDVQMLPRLPERGDPPRERAQPLARMPETGSVA